MKIELKNIKISDLVDKYQDSEEEGVTAFHGLLDVRPKYQREFIYKDEQRNAVIDTVLKGFPLNVMYWVRNRNEDGTETFEVLDGQQRTLSICQYVDRVFSYKGKDGNNPRFFHNLQEDEKQRILNYELTVYQCEGTDSEKLDWFKTINIAGEKLSDQELRNAVYAGSWLTFAKRDFSKTGCRGFKLGSDYITAKVDRQELLEKVLSWISNGKIEEYMAHHQNDNNSHELWTYYSNMIDWIKTVFPVVRKKEMRQVSWGPLYNKYKDVGLKLDPAKTEETISRLMADKDVTSKKGIYAYILSGDEKHLSIRVFDDDMKREAFERQKGICPKCKRKFEIEKMEADHITPWSKGGKTIAENCQMLCRDCNRRKSNS